MGRIARALGTKQLPAPKTDQKTNFPGQRGGQALWRQIFGTTKEEVSKNHPNPTPYPGSGGGYGTTAAGTDVSVRRLLEALRSKAPGGWSDNRYEQQRHYNGIAYVAIHRQNELLTQAEFQVYIEDPSSPDGKRPVTPEDPPQGDRNNKPYDLVELLKKPNPDDSFGDLVSMWNLQMETTGTALTWMVPNRLGFPMELYPIPTSIALGQPAVNPQYPHGYYRIQPVYPYGPFSSYPSPVSAVGAAVPAQWMMRFKYPHPILRYDGYSPMTGLKLHLDEVESIDRSRFYNMKKTFRPTAVLQFEEADGMQGLPEPEIERIRAEFEAAFGGPENAGSLFVSAPGSRIEEFGSRPIDMDYQAGWEQLVSFILGGYGITKPAAGMLEDSSYSTLFATLKQLYWLTLDPKTNRIGAKLTRFLAPFFGDNLIVEVRCKRIDDHEVTFKKISVGLDANCITKNEVRAELDMPKTTEPWGDEIATLPPMPPMPPGAVMGPDGMPMMPPVDPMQDPNADPNVVAGQDPDAMNAMGLLSGMFGEGSHGDKEEEKKRPRSGNMGDGSMGPRKHLEFLRSKYSTKNLNGANGTNGTNGTHKANGNGGRSA